MDPRETFSGVVYHDETQQRHEKPADVPVVWRLSSYAAVFNDAGELLIVQPTAYPDLWDLPGGGVEVEESIAEATEREVMEETKYRVKVEMRPVHIGESNFYYKSKDTFNHSVIIILPGTLLTPEPDESFINPEGDEIKDVRWIHPRDIDPQAINPIYRPFIESLTS